MQRQRTALALLTLCSATLASCGPQRIQTNLAPPSERLICDEAGKRPNVPAEYAIDWAKVTSVAQAKAEHVKYVASVRSREGVVAAYILNVEGKLFVCSNNAAWLRQWYKDTAAK